MKKKRKVLNRRLDLKKIWRRFEGEKYRRDLLDIYLKYEDIND